MVRSRVKKPGRSEKGRKKGRIKREERRERGRKKMKRWARAMGWVRGEE